MLTQTQKTFDEVWTQKDFGAVEVRKFLTWKNLEKCLLGNILVRYVLQKFRKTVTQKNFGEVWTYKNFEQLHIHIQPHITREKLNFTLSYHHPPNCTQDPHLPFLKIFF